MKINELMVGDWVNYKSQSSGKLSPIKIENIYGVEFNCEVEYWNIKSGYSISDTEPIKLTEDILVKNGFVYREEEETCATVAFHHWQLNGHSFALNYTQYFRKEKKDDMPRFDVAGIAIHYVHQLQHLLRMAGVQKEIEL